MTNRLSPRHALKALGAAFAGLLVALSLASPAAACDIKIQYTKVCDETTGTWVVTWTLLNDWHTDATSYVHTKISPDVSPKPAIHFAGDIVAEDGQGVVVPKKSGGERYGSLSGTQSLPGKTEWVKLTVRSKWTIDTRDKDLKEKSEKVVLGGQCGGGEPPATQCIDADQAKYQHTFNGPDGKATVRLKGRLPLCEGESQAFSLVSYYAPKPTFAVPQYRYDSDTKRITADRRLIHLNVDVPECNTQVDLIWGGKDAIIDELVADGPRYGNEKLGSKGPNGNRSEGPQGWYNGGTGTCAQPAAQFVSNCDGTVTVQLSNGEAGRYEAPFVVTGSNGFTRNVSVAPGKGESVVVPAGSADSITVTMDGKEVATGKWSQPENCTPPAVTAAADCDSLTITVTNPEDGMPIEAVVKPTAGQAKTLPIAPGKSASVDLPASGADFAATVTIGDTVKQVSYLKPATCGGGGGGGAAPTLPITGAKAGVIGGIAAALLAAGGGLFLFFRRRRVTFVS